MCKISDKSGKFLLNYSNVFRGPLFPDTVYIIQKVNFIVYVESYIRKKKNSFGEQKLDTKSVTQVCHIDLAVWRK